MATHRRGQRPSQWPVRDLLGQHRSRLGELWDPRVAAAVSGLLACGAAMSVAFTVSDGVAPGPPEVLAPAGPRASPPPTALVPAPAPVPALPAPPVPGPDAVPPAWRVPRSEAPAPHRDRGRSVQEITERLAAEVSRAREGGAAGVLVVPAPREAVAAPAERVRHRTASGGGRHRAASADDRDEDETRRADRHVRGRCEDAVKHQDCAEQGDRAEHRDRADHAKHRECAGHRDRAERRDRAEHGSGRHHRATDGSGRAERDHKARTCRVDRDRADRKDGEHDRKHDDRVGGQRHRKECDGGGRRDHRTRAHHTKDHRDRDGRDDRDTAPTHAGRLGTDDPWSADLWFGPTATQDETTHADDDTDLAVHPIDSRALLAALAERQRGGSGDPTPQDES